MKVNFLLLGLIFLLVSSVIGCGQSYTEQDVDLAYEAGHAEGYDAGSHAGYKLGYEVGYEEGKAKGYEAGREYGFTEGYNVEQAELKLAELDSEKQYDEGYQVGYEDGFRLGEDVGYDKGYQECWEYYNRGNSVSELFIEIISVTSPVSRGYYATLEAKTIPNILCEINVYYKSGKSEAFGLYPHDSDDEGYISWTWKVGTRTTPGRWKITVTAYDLDNWLSSDWPFATDTVYFEVK